MAVFTYFGKKIIPSPIVTVNKTYTRTGDNTPVSILYDINAKGTLLPNRGSPSSTGSIKFSDIDYLEAFDSGTANSDETWSTDDEKFTSLIRKKEQIRALFSTRNRGKELLWQSSDGTMTQSCFPEIKSVNFSDKIYVDRLDYDISFEANRLILGGDGVNAKDVVEEDLGEFHEYNIVSASDSFTLEENKDFSTSAIIYKFVRSVSAISKFRFSEDSTSNLFDPPATGEIPGNTSPLHTAFDSSTEAWQLARLWVENRIGNATYGVDAAMKLILATGTIGGDINLDASSSPTFFPYNRKRIETVDRVGGSYSIKESWDFSNGDHVVNMVIKHEIINPDSSGVGSSNRYTVSGSLKGLQNSLFDSGTKLDNALNGYKLSVLNDPPAAGENIYDNLLLEINQATGQSLSITDIGYPITEFKSVDTSNGIITFSFVFEDIGIPSSAVFSKISVNVSENHDENIIAAIPIPGRVGGPIIQDISTQSLVKRKVAAQFKLRGNRFTYVPDIEDIRISAISALKGSSYNVIDGNWVQGTDYWVTSFNDSLDIASNNFGMNIEFTLASTGTVPTF